MRFTVERQGEHWVVRDTEPPKGSPYKDGVIYITREEEKANDHRDHCNRSTRG